MYKQLRRFLAIKHGPEWASSLANIRQRTAQAVIRAVGPPLRKRKRGSPPQVVAPKVGPAEEPRPVFSQRDLALHLDADAGCQVLNGCFEASGGIGVQARPSPFGGGMGRSRCLTHVMECECL
jgi:hypothetical protein